MLLTIFVLFSLLCVMRAAASANRIGWRTGSLVSYAAALLTKETAIMLPAAVFLLGWFYVAEETGHKDKLVKSLCLVLPFAMLSCGYLLLRSAILKNESYTVSALNSVSMVLTWPSLLCEYGKLLIFPIGLSEFYNLAPLTSWSIGGFLLPLLFIVAIAVLLSWWSRRLGGKFVAFGAIWIVLWLAPVLYIRALQPGEILHERYLYLPSIGFCLLGGLAIGGSSVIGPMYIAEIAPAARRGRLVGMFQFNIVAGILVAYFSNYVIGTLGFGAAEWRWKLGISAIPALLFFVALHGIPQSPRWLVRRGRIDEACDVLARIGEPDPRGEARVIAESVRGESASASEPLFVSKYRFPIFLAIAIGIFNQFSGVNAILYYSNDIFEKAGFSKVSSDLQTVAIGLSNLLFTMIAMSMIDRLGRKKLLLIGAAGTACCLAGVAAIFATGQGEQFLVWLLVGFIGFFAFSQGAVIWVYLSEVFPNLVRAKGQSLGSFTHWIMNAMISAVFPGLAALSRPAPFAIFALITVVQFFVVLFVFPETAGITLEDMQKKLERAAG